MTNLADLAARLQTLFTADATEAARDSGFVRRVRKLTGPLFAQAVTFGWLHDPSASLADLAALAADLGTPVTASAIDQRFTPAAAAFLQALLARAVNAAAADPEPAEAAPVDPALATLLDRFTAVYVDDSTTIGLPPSLAEFFPGCGGKGGPTAALKVPLLLELRHGGLEVSDLQAGRACDLAGPLPHAPLPAGSLRLADLGYYSLEALQEYGAQGVGVLSRLPARTALFDPQGRRWKLHEFLAAQPAGPVDAWVDVGVQHRVRLRLLAWRVPAGVAQVRRQRLQKRAQKSGRPVSAAQATLAGWMVLVTNLGADRLSLWEACVLARLRWQVELLFKLWKGQGQLDESAGQRPWRVLCELVAKLLGLVVQHWAVLTAGPSLRQSQHRAAKRVRAAAERLAEALGDVEELTQALEQLRQRLRQVAGKQKRRGKPAAFQLLENPLELEADFMPVA
jgi:Transposase DDE domain